ncbi:MAG: VWA domain-containing protein, partial [Anaerolineae bacterium]|nr:VWA domain-containing protein [Anaerolineae bacterium]
MCIRDSPELALVLDRSGSMAGDKLREAKRAARSLIHALPQGARLAVVAYHDEVEVGGFTRKEAKAFLASLEAGGSTALHAGWQRGVELLADESRPRLVILLSDGLANMGLTDPEALAEEARRAASMGIYTVTLGFGEGYDRHLMAAMARAGGGVHHYVAQGLSLIHI